MAEGRMLKKAISMSRKLANLKTDSARLLYTWILPHVDVKGRFSGEPDLVRGYVVPRIATFTIPKIELYLKDMTENDLIILYKHNGDQYLEIKKFSEFQNLREDRESASKIPPPERSSLTPGGLPEDSGLSKDKLREVKGSEIKDKYILVFDEARKLFPGTKRKCQTEFGNFIKKHKNWRGFLPLLKPAIEQQIKWRQDANGEFRPSWKNFQTWINNSCWEEEGSKNGQTGAGQRNPQEQTRNPEKVGAKKDFSKYDTTKSGTDVALHS